MRIGDLPSDELARRCGEGLGWRVGPFALRVTTAVAGMVPHLAFLYGDFLLSQGLCYADAEVSVRRARGSLRRVSIYSDGRRFFGPIPRTEAIPLIEWTLNLCVFHRPSPHLLIHAAVVEKGGRAMILPGEAGAGKSTLCAALIHRGWRLLSDEVAVVRVADGRLLPVPRPVSLKGQAIEIVRAFAPEAVLGPTWPKTPKGPVAHLLPPRENVLRMDDPAEPAWIVFPAYRADVAAEMAPFSKAQSLMYCADHAFNYSVLGGEGFHALADLVDACACFELCYGDLESAVRRLEALADPAAASDEARRAARV